MSYATQEDLRKKTDDWEFRALKSEVDRLKSDKQRMRQEIGALEGKISNHRYAIEQLIQLLQENSILSECDYTLMQIRQML